MEKFINNLKNAWTWLRNKLGYFVFTPLVCFAFASQAQAQDLEFWKAQSKINQLLEQRIANLEKRVALLENKTPTAYTPGYVPPYVPPQTYAPAYSPPYVSSGNAYIPPVPDECLIPIEYYVGYGGTIPITLHYPNGKHPHAK